MNSRTWLWKCCSRADTSSCDSILRHARARAPRRTIARGPEGLGGRCAEPEPQRATAGGAGTATATAAAASEEAARGGGPAPSNPGRGGGGADVTERRRASQERAAASAFLRRWGRGEGGRGGTGA